MSQLTPTIQSDGSGAILTDLSSILSWFDAIRTNFSGASAPSSPLLGQSWYETDTGKFWVCTNATGPVWTDYSAYMPMTGGAFTGAVDFAKGANMAAAATLGLESATGNWLTVTGNTGITGITLSAGAWRLVRFSGTPTITYSSSLVLPTGTDIAVASGDFALFVGDVTGVVRCAFYSRADGRPLHGQLATLASALDTSTGILEQTGAATFGKRALGVGASTSIPTRADGDGRWQTKATLLTNIAADTASGLIEQTGTNTVAKRGIGVTNSTDLPTRADADGRYLKQGSVNIPVPAAGMRPKVTSGCAALTTLESTTNARNRDVLAFSGSAIEYAVFELQMPKSYDGGTILYRVHWESPGDGSNDARFGLQGVAVRDNSLIDAAPGTGIAVLDTSRGTTRHMISPWSTAVTLAGTPQGGDMVSFWFFRNGSHATDTISVDINVLGVDLLIGLDAADDT